MVKRIVESWLQVHEILAELEPAARRKVIRELSKLGHLMVPVSGAHLWIEVGNYLRTRRRVMNISQTDLAEKLGFSSQFLGRIESGKAPIPDAALKVAIRELELDQKKLGRIYAEAALDYVHFLFDERR